MTEEQKKKKREYMRKWYEKNKERRREYNSKWRASNQEQLKEYRKANRERHYEHQREYAKSQKKHCVYLLELPDCRMYIGSTNWLNHRLCVHRHNSNLYPDIRLYKAIAESGGWDNVRVRILMQDIPDEDLRLRLEQHFLDMIPDPLRLNTNEVIENEDTSQTEIAKVLDGPLGDGDAHLRPHY